MTKEEAEATIYTYMPMFVMKCYMKYSYRVSEKSIFCYMMRHTVKKSPRNAEEKNQYRCNKQ